MEHFSDGTLGSLVLVPRCLQALLLRTSAPLFAVPGFPVLLLHFSASPSQAQHLWPAHGTQVTSEPFALCPCSSFLLPHHRAANSCPPLAISRPLERDSSQAVIDSVLVQHWCSGTCPAIPVIGTTNEMQNPTRIGSGSELRGKLPHFSSMRSRAITSTSRRAICTAIWGTQPCKSTTLQPSVFAASISPKKRTHMYVCIDRGALAQDAPQCHGDGCSCKAVTEGTELEPGRAVAAQAHSTQRAPN